MTRKSTGEYPPNWKEIATLRTRAVLPIKFNMAFAAQRYQVGESVGFSVSVRAKIAQGDNMSNRQFFWQFVTVLPAMLTLMTISVSSFVALLFPVRPIVRNGAAFPMGTAIAAKVISKPLKATFIPTESPCCFTGSNSAFLSAHLASIRHSIRLALPRTIATMHRMCWTELVLLAASPARQSYLLHALRAGLRAVGSTKDVRTLSLKLLSASRASLCRRSILALKRTVPSPFRITWGGTKVFTASLTLKCDHAGIIP